MKHSGHWPTANFFAGEVVQTVSHAVAPSTRQIQNGQVDALYEVQRKLTAVSAASLTTTSQNVGKEGGLFRTLNVTAELRRNFSGNAVDELGTSDAIPGPPAPALPPFLLVC